MRQLWKCISCLPHYNFFILSLPGLTWRKLFCRRCLALPLFRQKMQILTNGKSYRNTHTGQIAAFLLEKIYWRYSRFLRWCDLPWMQLKSGFTLLNHSCGSGIQAKSFLLEAWSLLTSWGVHKRGMYGAWIWILKCFNVMVVEICAASFPVLTDS